MVKVILDCNGDWIDEREVEFVNIEEGPMGEDILTFVCPDCGEEHRSRRMGR